MALLEEIKVIVTDCDGNVVEKTIDVTESAAVNIAGAVRNGKCPVNLMSVLMQQGLLAVARGDGDRDAYFEAVGQRRRTGIHEMI
ncbi:hypothetical protein ACFL08_05660 [Patescibacteria group bacterium]